MATFTSTKAAPFGAITTFRAIHAVETARNNFVAWNTRRSTYKLLSALSARELEDIGMCRSDVENLNTGFFRY